MDFANEKEFVNLMRYWEENHNAHGFDPVPVLNRMCEVMEFEMENYLKTDPDPFEEFHPSRVSPGCEIGQILKHIFKKDVFVNKLMNDYLRENYWSRNSGNNDKDVRALNTVACRLMIDLLPGIEIPVIFDLETHEGLIQRLCTWVETERDELQTYATGLIAAALDVHEVANACKENTNKLVPILLDRLHRYFKEATDAKITEKVDERPFSQLSMKRKHDGELINGDNSAISSNRIVKYQWSSDNIDENNVRRRSVDTYDGLISPITTRNYVRDQNSFNGDTSSNSSWKEMEACLVSNVPIFPITVETKQMFILKYLASVGHFAEVVSHLVEKSALKLTMQIVDPVNWKNSRITFEALKTLACIISHKKFSLEFVNSKGVELLLKVPRLGITATGAAYCFYCLAHMEDAMEILCSSNSKVIPKLVSYNLELLNRTHPTCRGYATEFFGLAFQYKNILHEFDNAHGLRTIYNVLCTLPIIADAEEDLDVFPPHEDEQNRKRMLVKNICTALKRYFLAHLHKKVEISSGSLPSESSFSGNFPIQNKAGKITRQNVRDEISFLQDCNLKSSWKPVDEFMKMEGITMMLKIIGFTYEWNYSGRVETVRSALDVINVCSVLTNVQWSLCDMVQIPSDGDTLNPGLKIILAAAEGEVVVDSEVQKSALSVLITCACPPIFKELVNVSVQSKKKNASGDDRSIVKMSKEEVLKKVWECIRTSNGLMSLTSLMTVKTPITEADAIRAMACQVLAGLARSETVKQIIGKLPFFTKGQLQTLMNEPVLQDRRQEHAMFQKYGVELMEKVIGKTKNAEALEVSAANMYKANVVAQTNIQFSKKQLHQIIYEHFMNYGLTETAETLQREANLTPLKAPTINGTSLMTPSPFRLNKQMCSGTHSESKIKKAIIETSSPSVSGTPIRLNVNARKSDSKNYQFATPNRVRQRVSLTRNEPIPMLGEEERIVTLDSIVTEYLANQHSLCKNPIITCAEFDLLKPHKCSDGRPKKLYTNFANRYNRYRTGCYTSRRLDSCLTHSRFSPVKTLRPSDDEGYYLAIQFLDDRYLLAGTCNGHVKLIDVYTGVETVTHQCHDSYISNISINNRDRLFTTSALWHAHMSGLWKIHDDRIEKLILWQKDSAIEFSKVYQDKLIGTDDIEANIYDVATYKKLLCLKSNQSNRYQKNRATFHPTDDLVLNDGVLWDVNSGKEIHKFDKLNQTINGVFHPNGLEIVSNTEVWDIRTFHLLRTVPLLDQTSLVFTQNGLTFYMFNNERDIDEGPRYESSFKTFDSYDYSNITTVDVKKSLCYLSSNISDTQIATVENNGMEEDYRDTVIRLYDVGRSKDEDDVELPEDEDEEEEEIIDSDDSDDDGTVELILEGDITDNAMDLSIADDEDDDDIEDEDDDDDDDDEDDDDINDIIINTSSDDEDDEDYQDG